MVVRSVYVINWKNMSNLLDGIENYLSMESTGALMVSGEWGCGKTYHIENVVIPALRDKGFNPVKISLFGIESVGDIPLKIAECYKPQENSEKDWKWWSLKKKSQANNVAAKGGQFLSSVTWLSDYVDIKALVAKYSNLLYKAIPSDKTVLFLDDIERVIDTIDIHTLLGAINELVEQHKYKVVVIANNSYIQQQGEEKLVFKEKVIEKTLVYEPDVVAIYNEICDKKHETPFRDLMKGEIPISVIDPNFLSYKEDKDLLANLRNIRILKFALSHFHIIHDACKDFLDNEDKTIADKFLFSLWASTVGIAIEYKKNRLSYKDREQFVHYVDFSAIDWQFDGGNKESEDLFVEIAENSDEKDKEKKREEFAYKRITHIFHRIVKDHGLPEIICPQIFDFVTAGVSLNKDELKTTWESYKSQVLRSIEKPAYQLLQRFLMAQWQMSNEEMAEALVELTQFVEDGEYNDNISYVNAATFLQHLGELTPFSKEEIEEKIIKGIDKMYGNVTSLNILDKTNLDVVSHEIPQISQWVIDYENKKMAEISAIKMDDKIQNVCRQFMDNLPALAERITIQYGSSDTPEFASYPILSHITKEMVFEKARILSPQDVMALLGILKSRFQQMVNPSIYDAELPFVDNLKLAIDQRKEERQGNKQYADILIDDQLMKVINQIQKTVE